MIETVTFGFEIGGVQTDSCVDMDNLHANDGVDEEEHGDEQDDVGERLEGLDEGPEKDPVLLKVICFAILTTTTMVYIISHP